MLNPLRRRVKTERSIAVVPKHYGAFAFGGAWIVAQVDHRDMPIEKSRLCMCLEESHALFLAQAVNYTLSSVALAKPVLDDLIEH